MGRKKKKSVYTYAQLQKMQALNACASDWLLDMRPCAFDRLTPRSDLIEVLQYPALLI